MTLHTLDFCYVLIDLSLKFEYTFSVFPWSFKFLYAFRHHDQAVIFERPCKEVEELKHLLTTRQRLIKQKKAIRGSFKRAGRQTRKDILIRLSKRTKPYPNPYPPATSVSGVGKKTAISLLVATNEFKIFSSAKQLASYVGVVPFTHQSGLKYKKKK